MNAFSRQVTQWKVADLRESPYQQSLFDDLTPGQFDELVADMKARGQRDPAEALPDGTLLDGHQRLRAARVLGWPELAVVVRVDLADASPPEIEAEMVAANLHRRQMDIVSVARLFKRLKQIERNWDPDEFPSAGREDLRDRLARHIGGRSGRTMDRYVQLLETPREVQVAVSTKSLAMGAALKVAKLSDDAKASIAAAIRQGQPAKDVIAAYFEARRSSPPSAAARELIATLTIAAAPRAEDATPPAENEEDLGVLRGPVEDLNAAIGDVIRAELTPKQKISAIVQAIACLDSLLDEAEMEAAE